MQFIEPLSDENARLVNEGGLFTKAPDDRGIVAWIQEHFDVDEKVGSYVKIVIPNRGRDDCLRMLARMNITHLSLFPDLYGASKHEPLTVLRHDHIHLRPLR